MRLLPRRYQLGFASTRQRPLVALTTSAGCPEAAAGPSVAIGSRAGTLTGGLRFIFAETLEWVKLPATT